MKKLTLLLFLISISFFIEPAIAQRTVEVINGVERGTHNVKSIIYGNKVYVFEGYENKMLSFDGEILTPINFPSDFSFLAEPNIDNLAASGGFIYLILFDYVGTIVNGHAVIYYRPSLFRFDGANFFSVNLPGEPISDLVVFQGLLYVAIWNGRQTKLLSYDGVSVTEVYSELKYPEWDYIGCQYQLHVADQYLYIFEDDPNGLSWLKRFDGSSFSTIWSRPGDSDIDIATIEAIPRTDKLYFKLNREIFYFDGTATRLVYEIVDDPDQRFHTFIVWNNKLYFQPGNENVIYQHDGSTLTTLTLPDGASPIPYSDITIYEDRMYIPTRFPDSADGILAYDGNTFLNSFSYSEEQDGISRVCVRGNELIILPSSRSDRLPNTIYAYRNSAFSEIIAPTEKSFDFYPLDIPEIECTRLWVLVNDKNNKKLFAKEDLSCPPPTVSNIIPEHLREYERVEFDLWARIPDWCWTDLFIDWEIDPICPVPEVCPDPLFRTMLTDLKGEIAWQETFEKPLKMAIPLEGKERYQFSLATLANGEPEDLFILDDDLVGDGFKGIHTSMTPKKGIFNLSVSTENDKKLPFKLMLLDKNGETLWEQEFMAPMDKQIKANDVMQGGATLRFASISDSKDLKDYGITKVNYYPNSFAGKLEVEISTIEKKEVPLELTIYDIKGNQVLQEKIVAPTRQPIQLYGQKEGLYIAELRVGEAVHTENLILEY